MQHICTCVSDVSCVWKTHVIHIIHACYHAFHVRFHAYSNTCMAHLYFETHAVHMSTMFAMCVLHALQESCMLHTSLWYTCNTCVSRYMIELHICGIFVLVYILYSVCHMKCRNVSGFWILSFQKSYFYTVAS